ncbi:hypothetical protein [Streptomyces longispororuber]|uniref:hypothetical protein n=1 Tax=Streptomyces longispororuber TaxID=68230 RepID=UPI00210EC429|nr:hypothetical protein [Streptomyces longispororuber]MCQ4210332.1 hypothetical protein [Streptomyces longispororuber]
MPERRPAPQAGPESAPVVRRARRRWAAVLTATVLGLGSGLPAAGAPVQAAAHGWLPEAAPVDQASLLAVAQVGPRTTWAAGVELSQSGKAVRQTPLLLARDDRAGDGWRRVQVPGVDSSGSRFNAVSAAAPDDVWLTGDATADGILTAHWDGAAWQTVSAPVPSNDGAGLLGVATVSPADAWAVGWATAADGSGAFTGLIEHWEGASWRPVPLPAGSSVAALDAVTAVSARDVWAAGFDTDDQPVLLHYDGAAWKQLPRPPIGGPYGEVNALAAAGPDDVWAVGRVVTDENDRGHALALHWDGTAWHRLRTPASAGPLSSVAVTPHGALAVGQDPDRTRALALRWTGGTVLQRDLPAPAGADSAQPTGIEADAGAATVVGAANSPGADLPAPLLLTGRR